jgi:hypothetical protein
LFYNLKREVIEGSETLNKIEQIETLNQRPRKICKIADCGIFKIEA